MPNSLKRRPRTVARKPSADTEASEFCAVTVQAIDQLLARRAAASTTTGAAGRRRAIRWPFPGTVELWLPDGRGGERYALGTSINLSHDGIGIHAEEEVKAGTRVQIAIHEPEVTFHGRATVRHCTDFEDGSYILGLQFLFDTP